MQTCGESKTGQNAAAKRAKDVVAAPQPLLLAVPASPFSIEPLWAPVGRQHGQLGHHWVSRPCLSLSPPDSGGGDSTPGGDRHLFCRLPSPVSISSCLVLLVSASPQNAVPPQEAAPHHPAVPSLLILPLSWDSPRFPLPRPHDPRTFANSLSSGAISPVSLLLPISPSWLHNESSLSTCPRLLHISATPGQGGAKAIRGNWG
ncbi:hypothetical protein QBC47DRAFT_197234 [Echria macrotheca]|uniref:Uncharacterized protein n=1 Tax=Echria macrotheca TaxID=438768 RepID=A0AAJ0BEI1_9PEZI|nr:hypothetical protein QBC47DRAFT_197234 [Echria macrotheca]